MCIAQLKEGDLHKNDDISHQQICSCDNLVDISTKSLPSIFFEQLIQKLVFVDSEMVVLLRGRNKCIM